MQPINFNESNLNLKAGNNPNTDDMHVAICENRDIAGEKNIVHCVSVWKPTPEELAEINRNGIVYVSQMYWPVPPLSVMAFDPFKHYGYLPLKKVLTTRGAVFVHPDLSACPNCAEPKRQSELDVLGGWCANCNNLQ